jgi:hypothetical protein
MSDIWALTLIGVIGDVQRFQSCRKLKKFLGFSAEGSQSGTSLDKTRMSYSGVRDSRRVLFQMALVLISPNAPPNVFRFYYHQLILHRNPPMPKMKALGHVCGKIAQAIYGCLKSDELYDGAQHAKVGGLKIEESEKNNPKNAGGSRLDRPLAAAQPEDLEDET